MHVSIDVARQNEFSVALDPAGTDRDAAFFAAGDAVDFVAINDNNGVFFLPSAGLITSADQRNFLSERAGVAKRRSDEEKQQFES